MLDKEIYSQKIKYVRDAFWFSLGAYALAVKEPTSNLLEHYNISVNERDIYVSKGDQKTHTDWLTYNIKFHSTLTDGSAKMFVRQTFFYMILETFEAAKNYAETNQKLGEFKSQDWYAFTRHLRNAIGHNGVWNIRKNSKDLPATFRNKTIELSFNGTELGDFIGWTYGLQLCAVISLWVSQN